MRTKKCENIVQKCKKWYTEEFRIKTPLPLHTPSTPHPHTHLLKFGIFGKGWVLTMGSGFFKFTFYDFQKFMKTAAGLSKISLKCTILYIWKSFFGVYLKFDWLRTSKNSTFRIFPRKNLTMRRYFRTFWVLWRHFRWFSGSVRAKNQSKVTFSSYFDQANSPYGGWYPKKTFPFVGQKARNTLCMIETYITFAKYALFRVFKVVRMPWRWHFWKHSFSMNFWFFRTKFWWQVLQIHKIEKYFFRKISAACRESAIFTVQKSWKMRKKSKGRCKKIRLFLVHKVFKGKVFLILQKTKLFSWNLVEMYFKTRSFFDM